MESLATYLSQQLEPIAAWFRSFNMPDPIVHWGHPVMMAIVVLVMGSTVAYAGWYGRLAADKDAALKSRIAHRRLAAWMSTFLFLGYTGGILSLVMQHHSILGSPHFWTGTVALGLLGLNGMISATKFGGEKPALRMVHAYVGTVVMALLIVHGIFGLKLGLSITGV